MSCVDPSTLLAGQPGLQDQQLRLGQLLARGQQLLQKRHGLHLSCCGVGPASSALRCCSGLTSYCQVQG